MRLLFLSMNAALLVHLIYIQIEINVVHNLSLEMGIWLTFR
jgi:hypothetical protein